MGADLITHICVGPEKVKMNPERLNTIIETSLWMQDAIKRHYAKTPFASESQEDFISRYEENFGYFDETEEDLAEALETVSSAKRVRMAEELCEEWPLFCRDSSMRYLGKNKVIVVAGERTWGDMPDGDSYQLLDQIIKLELYEIMGLC